MRNMNNIIGELGNGELGVVYDNWQQERLEFNMKYKSICTRKSKFLAMTSTIII